MDSSSRIKLLVVDDEPAILEMIQSHFSLRGFQVITAEDGPEGLVLLEKERPDVVLLDLKMKKLDGNHFLRQMREKNLPAKVIVITGYQDESLRKEIGELGVDAFLEKPVSIVELQKKVYELTGAPS